MISSVVFYDVAISPQHFTCSACLVGFYSLKRFYSIYAIKRKTQTKSCTINPKLSFSCITDYRYIETYTFDHLPGKSERPDHGVQY